VGHRRRDARRDHRPLPARVGTLGLVDLDLDLDIDSPGYVPWWPHPEVKLFNILVHVLTETNRHAGHADILREQLDGAIGTGAGRSNLHERDADFWANHRAKIEHAAKKADQS
jgi:hypothetical protein